MSSRPEQDFLGLLVLHGIPSEDIETEYVFHHRRKWRADFYIPKANLLLEVEGGVFSGKPSRHTTPTGYRDDCAKYSVASAMGYKLIRTTTDATQMLDMARLAGRVYAVALSRSQQPSPPHSASQ